MKDPTQIPNKSCYIEVVKDSYFLIDKNGDLVFNKYGRPIYNSNVKIAERLARIYPDVEMKFLETCYLEIDLSGDFDIKYL